MVSTKINSDTMNLRYQQLTQPDALYIYEDQSHRIRHEIINS